MAGAALVGGRYRLGAPLGAGGQGRVFGGHDLWAGERPVAVKVMPRSESAALAAEFVHLRGLSHPGLVPALDLVLEGDTAHLVEALIEGEPLAAWARRHEATAVCRAVLPVVQALAHLHARRLVHLDVSPQNVLVRPSDGQAVLIDLGLARRAGERGARGTPGFVAPEVLEGEPAGPAADVFGMGASLAAALGGAATVTGAGDLGPIRSEPLRRVLAAALRAAPASRPDAHRLLMQLAEVAAVPGAQLERPIASVPLLGRAHVLERVQRWLAGTDGRLSIAGPPGSGKSAALAAAADLARLAGYQLIDIGGAEARSGERLLSRLGLVPGEGAPLDDARRVLLQCQARGGRVCLAVDDVERAPPLVQELLSLVAGRGGHVRVLTAGEVAPALGVVAPLEPLSREVVHELLRYAYAAERPRAEAEHLWEVSGGRPRALMAALRELARTGGGALALEGGVVASAEARQAPLDLAPFAAAEGPLAGAVAKGLAEAAGVSGTRLAELLAEGWLAVEAAAGGEVVYREPGGAAAALPSDAVERWLPVLADLELRRGAPCEAALAYARGGQAGPALAALERARAAPASWRMWLEAARRLGPQLPPEAFGADLLADWATAAARLGDEESSAVLARLFVLRGEPARARGLLAGVAVRCGRYAEALQELGEATAGSADLDAGLAADLEAIRARALLFAGRAREARGVAEAALPEAAGAAKGELLDVLGHSAQRLGEAELSLSALRDAAELAVASGDAARLRRAQHALGVALQRSGRHAEALELYQASLRGEDPLLVQRRQVNLATALQDCGRFAEALVAYREAWSAAVATANEREQARLGVNLANLEVQLGDLARGSRRAAETATACDAAGLEEAGLLATLILAEAALEADDLPAAAAALERAAGRAAAVQDVVARAELALLLARQLAAAGRLEAAVAALPAPVGGAPHIERQAAVWRARWLLSQERLADALSAARAGAELLVGDDELAWRLLAVGARAASRGGGDDAERWRRMARAKLDATLERVPPELRAGYLGVASRREPARWLEVTGAGSPAPAFGAGPVAKERRLGAAAYARLLAINRRLARERAPQPLLELILDGAIELLGAERGFVVLRQGEEVRVAVARHFDRRALERGAQRISRSIALAALSTGEPLLTTNALEDERFAGQASVVALQVRSVLCVPLRGTSHEDDPVIGALYLDHRSQERAFGEDDVELCNSFADQAAIALETAALIGRIQDQEKRLAEQNRDLESLNAELREEAAAHAAEAEAALRRLREASPAVGVGRGFERFVGRSDKLREALRLVERFADTDVAVFVSGESGSGKELVARAIHERSSRATRPFVSVNCGAIPETLIESELFGYVRGAFTGAVRDKRGLLSAASGGTLFLDEVGEMPPAMQVKLLRVLQEKEVQPVGAAQPVKIDVRVVSASHDDLEELVAEGRFREDLFYRLHVVQIRLPPLRERRSDIPALVDHFCRQARGEGAEACFSEDAIGRLLAHDWPGNVRELENEVRRALALADGRVGVDDLSDKLRKKSGGDTALLATTSRGSLRDIMDGFERQVLLATLKRTGWNVKQAAKELGLSRAALYTRLSRFGIAREGKDED